MTYNNGGLTIGKATLTVSGTNNTTTYNGSAQTNSGASISGRQGTDAFTISGYGTGTNASNTAYADNLALTATSGTLDNYTVTYNNGGLTIGKATATVAATKTYDATTGLIANQVSITGIGGATLGFTIGSAHLSDANVPTSNKYLVLGTLALSAGGSGTSATSNYVLPASAYGANNSATVSTATLTVSGTNSTTTYTGSAQTNSGASISGRQGADSFTITGYGSGTNAGTYSDSLVATAAGSTLASNYNITYNNGSLTIGKASLTVTADNKTKVYGDANPSFTATITGYVNGEGSTAITGTPALSTTATQYSNVTSYPITPAVGTLAASNYSFTYANGSLVITAAPLTITGASTSPTYTGLAQTNSAATISGIKGSSDAFTISGYGSGTNAGTYNDSLVATAAGSTNAANYNITINNGSLTIGKANATVTANSANPTYNGQIQSVSGFTASGLVNSETAAVLTGIVASGAAGTNAGTYTNIVTGTDANYNLTLVNGTLTIAKANAIVTGNSANVTYNGQSQSVSGFTATNLVNGQSAAVLTGVTASGATGINAGTYTNTVIGTDANYNLTLVNGTISIAKAGLTVTGATTNATYSGQAQTNSGASISGRQGADSFTITGYGSGTNAGTYSDSLVATAAGSTLASNYNITYNNGSLTIGKASLTVTADNKTKVYGDANPSFTATITGYVNGEGSTAITGTPALSTTATQYSNVTSYPITPAVGTLAASNYSFTYANGSLVITAAPLTITGASTSPTYTGLAQTNSAATISGIKGSSDAFTISGYGSGTNAGTYNDSLVATAAGSTNAANYNITINNGSLTIGKANLSATGTQTYNGTTTFNANNLVITGVNGETITATGSADLANKNVQTNQPLLNINGLNLVAGSNASLSNYLPLDAAHTSVSVTALPISFVAPTITKVYDGGYAYNISSADLANMSLQLVGGDKVAAAAVSFASNEAGPNKVVNLISAAINDGNGGNNYNIAHNSNGILATSNTSIISKAALTIAAANDAKFAAVADGSGYAGLIINGLVNGETVANLNGSATITRTNAPTGSAVYNASNVCIQNCGNLAGVYTGVLQPSGYTSPNYNITYVNGDYTIVPAQTLLIRVTSGVAVSPGVYTNPATVVYGNTPNYHVTAQYLYPNTTTPVDLPVSNNGLFVVNDGAGSSASFALSANLVAQNAQLSRAGYLPVGAYNLVNTGTSITGQNFLSMLTVGSLTVTPMKLSPTQLGVAGISKVYDGSAAITGAGSSGSGSSLNVDQLASAILANDVVAISATGQFNNQNVGTGKAVVIDVTLSGPDAGNYILVDSNNLPSTRVTGNIGTITQLQSVNYVGVSGGNWSNAANWAGGAIPTSFTQTINGVQTLVNNVAQVTIPNGVTVNYDSIAVGQVGSTITNNGVINFTGGNDFTFANAVSGSGSISLSGAGITTIVGSNSYSGGTNINTSQLKVGSTNALGTGSVTSAGGSINVDPAITLPSLTVNGPVTLLSDINTVSNQTYNGAVTLGAGNAVNGVITPMVLSSASGNITFNGTLNAGAGSLGAKRSLTINVGSSGTVSFMDRVGANIAGVSYDQAILNAFQNGTAGESIYQLIVNAGNTSNPGTILIKGDVTTFEAQTYNGNIRIGGNGPTDLVRTLLSEDPVVTLNGLVDDTNAGVHTLLVRAITMQSGQTPTININQSVGSIAALAALDVKTGTQKPINLVSYVTETYSLPTQYSGIVNIAGNVTTTQNQTYTGNAINLGSQSANTAQVFTTNGGIITFNIGQANGGGITSSGTEPVNFALNGGSLRGLGNSNLNYRQLGLTEAQANFNRVDIYRPVNMDLLDMLERHFNEVKMTPLRINYLAEVDVGDILSDAQSKSSSTGKAKGGEDSNTRCSASVSDGKDCVE